MTTDQQSKFKKQVEVMLQAKTLEIKSLEGQLRAAVAYREALKDVLLLLDPPCPAQDPDR